MLYKNCLLYTSRCVEETGQGLCISYVCNLYLKNRYEHQAAFVKNKLLYILYKLYRIIKIIYRLTYRLFSVSYTHLETVP